MTQSEIGFAFEQKDDSESIGEIGLYSAVCSLQSRGAVLSRREEPCRGDTKKKKNNSAWTGTHACGTAWTGTHACGTNTMNTKLIATVTL